jgi:hypothetical protein
MNPISIRRPNLLLQALLIVITVGLFTGCNPVTDPTATPQAQQPTPTPAPPPSTPANLPLWSSSFTVGAANFPFTMVGTDPRTPGAGTSTVPVQIIPVRFNFGGTLVTPEQAACGDTTPAAIRAQNSPLFTNVLWTDGVTIGTTQFIDAFQRANFWSIVSTQSPNYHVVFQPSLAATFVVDVPPASGASLLPNPVCPAQPIAVIPSPFMDSVVQAAIAAQHITPGTLPLFITMNTQFILGGSPALGYHNAFGPQTFAVASYAGPGFAPGVDDVLVISHELGEWMDNPFVANQTLPWGPPGQCSTQLEVGDILAGKSIAVPMPGFTYHVQELAYFSWLARFVPSIAINGRYSMQSTLTGPAPLCQ